MIYSVALTKTGQMTLPKELREFLGLEGARRVVLEKETNKVTIQKKASKEETFAFFDSNISKKTRKIMEKDRKNGVVTVAQIRKGMAKDPKVQARWRKKYGN